MDHCDDGSIQDSTKEELLNIYDEYCTILRDDMNFSGFSNFASFELFLTGFLRKGFEQWKKERG